MLIQLLGPEQFTLFDENANFIFQQWADSAVSLMHKANYAMLHRLNLLVKFLTLTARHFSRPWFNYVHASNLSMARVHGYAVCMLCSCVIKGALFLMGAIVTCLCSIVQPTSGSPEYRIM